MQLLKTLYLLNDGSRVNVRKDALEVRREGMLQGRFPLEGLEAVYAIGRTEMTSDSIARCVEHRIRVSFHNRSGRIRFIIGGPISGNIHLRVAQHRAADNPAGALRLASVFVAGKLQNQRRVVQRWAWDADGHERRFLERQHEIIAERLTSSRDARSGDHLRGYEGDATRRYFKAMGAHLNRAAPQFVFLRRTRRPPGDPVNCVLSFVYGLLTAELIGAIEAVGLDSQIGFLHGARPGRPSLALDMLEEFRPGLGDRFATAMFTHRQLGPEHFTAVAESAWYLTDAGRRLVVSLFDAARSDEIWHPVLEREIPRASLPGVQATLLARHLRGDLPVYPPFVVRP